MRIPGFRLQWIDAQGIHLLADSLAIRPQKQILVVGFYWGWFGIGIICRRGG